MESSGIEKKSPLLERAEAIELPKEEMKVLGFSDKDIAEIEGKIMNISLKAFPLDGGIIGNFQKTIEKIKEGIALKKEIMENNGSALDMCVIRETKNNGKEEIRLSIDGCATYLLIKYNIVTSKDDQKTFFYNGKFYSNKIEQLIKEDIKKVLKNENNEYDVFRTNHIKEIMLQIQSETFIDAENFQPPISCIPTKNGIYDFENDTLTPSNPNYFFTSIIGAEYNPSAKCDNFLKFLNEVVNEEDIPNVQEIFGYCLYRKYPIQKAFMLIGSGANGKSVLLNVLKAFLGQDSCVNIPLQDLETNRFASSRLRGKLANIFADLSDKSLYQTGHFKLLTGGDPIGAEQKFREGFDFLNYAKLIYSCNKLPETYDQSIAFFRRWLIINFPNVFTPDKADTKLLEKLTTENELSGILNWALEGLKRLLSSQKFFNDIPAEEMARRYLRLSDSLEAFIQDMIEINCMEWMEKGNFYRTYVEYCKKYNMPIKTKDKVSKDLPKRIAVIDERKKIGDKFERGWKGIKLKENEDILGGFI